MDWVGEIREKVRSGCAGLGRKFSLAVDMAAFLQGWVAVQGPSFLSVLELSFL